MARMTHAYYFAHRYLPRMLLRTQGGQRWLPLLRAPEGGPGFVVSLWRSAANDLPAEDRRFLENKLGVRTHDVEEIALTLIDTPAPTAIAEARCILVASAPTSDAAHEVFRVFTRERSQGPDIVGEWSAGGRHTYHGPIDQTADGSASEAAFVARVVALLGPLVRPNALRRRGSELLDTALASTPDAASATRATIDLLTAAAADLAATHSWAALAVALTARAKIAGDNGAPLDAQAMWLALSPGAEPALALSIATGLVERLPPGHELAALAAAAAFHKSMVMTPPEHVEEIRPHGFRLLMRAAGPEIAGDRERFMAWVQERGLGDPRVFMSAFYDAVLAFVPGDDWRFDPYAVTGLLMS